MRSLLSALRTAASSPGRRTSSSSSNGAAARRPRLLSVRRSIDLECRTCGLFEGFPCTEQGALAARCRARAHCESCAHTVLLVTDTEVLWYEMRAGDVFVQRFTGDECD